MNEQQDQNLEPGDDPQSIRSGADIGIAFGPLPDLSDASLPSNVESQAFMDAVRSLRSAFESREDYSAFLCTQIASRGVIPNATMVLSIGGWGSKGDVNRDVKAWYAQIARRATEYEFSLPASLRAPALRLLEELWMVAARQAQNHIAADREKAQAAIKMVQTDLLAAQKDVAAAQEESRAIAATRDTFAAQRDGATRLAQDLREQLDRAEQRYQECIQRLESDRAAYAEREDALRLQHAREMECALEQMQDEHRQSIEQIKSEMQARLDAESAARTKEVTDLRQALEASARELQSARQQAREAEVAATRQVHQMALSLDKARQEAIGSAQQAIAAQKAEAAAVAEAAEIQIRMSLLERDFSYEKAQKEDLQAALSRKSAELEQAQETLSKIGSAENG